ncbi:hypothetical protein [Rhizosphaericola mali]|uniref:DUF4116 domain-containing protein n=1 Tax=Rhizosphaericola mali TaxID=2545455 RepID=A0A5P2G577_9BACT|nr:hypothetical protein [Rhizosphaericola mali]QES88253.1 hypothetical protein E0W69_006075 [Rhizosphaericola mali]
MNKILPIISSIVLSIGIAQAQSNYPIERASFHDNIDNSQKRILNLDHKDDSLFTPSESDEKVNEQATFAATSQIDSIQSQIESDKNMDSNTKIKYLRGLNDLLSSFIMGFKSHSIKGGQLTTLISAFDQSMALEQTDQAITPIVYKSPLAVGKILINNFAFRQNSGLEDSKQILITKECGDFPHRALDILENHPEYKSTDSVIVAVAHRDPDYLYNYAAATTRLGNVIRKNPDLLVATISSMATRKTGRQYFPFLDNLYKGTITFDAIDKTLEDPTYQKYYSLLVNTEVEYSKRILESDTPMGMKALGRRLKDVSIDPFVNTINGLHESPDAVRFKSIMPLTPQELYYLAVLNEEELYTSSYLHGVYKQIFEKGGKGYTGDKLLMSVYFDHFKKWIKMAANYNKLEDFLATMNPQNSELLMRQFVRNLDKTQGTDSLEDAVDVAGSFASIKDPKVRNLVLDEVQVNLEHAKATGNKKAINIYDILNTLFLSMDPKNNIDVSKSLGIEPVYYMPIKELKDDKGRIIIQQFFYGDKDGQTGYNNFLATFSGKGWKTTHTAEWSIVSSTIGTPVIIYFNKPLDEEKGLDDKAQQDLDAYLEENDIHPTLVIHRGHSYYLPTTIKQLVPSAKVVMLGSCGGFQSLSDVLNIAPEAHIISSRQTGTNLVNISVISGIINNLRDGKTLNWVDMWKGFSNKLNGNAEFADYVPPYNNLGAVFLMAYKKLQEKEEKE